uniref:Uncharacterized protein n=1 Tax=Anguilla anguilla TaxID=7936 RepID=A0A0E9PQN1_ANGAN
MLILTPYWYTVRPFGQTNNSGCTTEYATLYRA